jgi:hypothetical protein
VSPRLREQPQLSKGPASSRRCPRRGSHTSVRRAGAASEPGKFHPAPLVAHKLLPRGPLRSLATAAAWACVCAPILDTTVHHRLRKAFVGCVESTRRPTNSATWRMLHRCALLAPHSIHTCMHACTTYAHTYTAHAHSTYEHLHAYIHIYICHTRTHAYTQASTRERTIQE